MLSWQEVLCRIKLSRNTTNRSEKHKKLQHALDKDGSCPNQQPGTPVDSDFAGIQARNRTLAHNSLNSDQSVYGMVLSIITHSQIVILHGLTQMLKKCWQIGCRRWVFPILRLLPLAMCIVQHPGSETVRFLRFLGLILFDTCRGVGAKSQART